MCSNINIISNCLCTWTLKVLLESIKLGFINRKTQNTGKFFYLPLVLQGKQKTVSVRLLTFGAVAVTSQQITALPLLMEVRHNCSSHSVMDELGCTTGQMYAGQTLWDTTVWIPKRTEVLFTQNQAIFANINQLGFVSTLIFCVSIAWMFLVLLNQCVLWGLIFARIFSQL